METRERIEQFFMDTNAKKTQFCRKVDVSPSYLYRYLKGEYMVSQNLIDRINSYLDEVYKK